MDEYDAMTLGDYRDALASGDPTPGGGTAAAVALAQGAALTQMVCNLTLGREKWADGHEAANTALEVSEPLLTEGHTLAALDATAFDDVMAAFRMPKESDEEKAARRAAIHAGTLKAAEVPMRTARAGAALMAVLPALARHGNANAVTDVGVAGLLASAACKGALLNVDINLDGLPADIGVEMREESARLREESKTVSREIMMQVRERMSS